VLRCMSPYEGRHALDFGITMVSSQCSGQSFDACAQLGWQLRIVNFHLTNEQFAKHANFVVASETAEHGD